jgi:squalene-hopene/tetraprenyl-beta-curcumene cyclase
MSAWSPAPAPRVLGGPRSALARAIIARYGKDRTFSVPILTMCALAGRLGAGRAAWRHVIPLPFELAALPHRFFAALRLPVVSYALPALIAIGQARHVHAPSWNPLVRLVRVATRKKTLRKLTEIQPPNGGFLEATPLTSFVTMSLAGSGHADHVVTRRGSEFLLKSQRADGSWPIDTNLATWCTTLAVNALPESALADGAPTLEWLLRQQYRTVHPYTNAAPGGWAWTDLPGGVPDADDTAGALLALERLQTTLPEAERGKVREAAVAGLRWLMALQSDKDRGVPTFCRGWGRLPFDRSAPDITGHAVRAWMKWLPHLPELGKELFGPSVLALLYLEYEQRASGAWAPLWFGNQHARDEENLVYGTARIILGTTVFCSHPRLPDDCLQGPYAAYDKAARWLVEAQGADGGWSGDGHGPSSMEETAVATEALAHYVRYWDDWRAAQAARAGALWLIERVESGRWREAAPVGFYFAKLWYYERLYPMIFTVAALRETAQWIETAPAEA